MNLVIDCKKNRKNAGECKNTKEKIVYNPYLKCTHYSTSVEWNKNYPYFNYYQRGN